MSISHPAAPSARELGSVLLSGKRVRRELARPTRRRTTARAGTILLYVLDTNICIHVLKHRDRRLLHKFRAIRHLGVLPWDEDATQHYGVIRADLRKQGLMIGGNDLLIAAQARAASAVLVTNNTRQFGRVPDLTVEDWLG